MKNHQIHNKVIENSVFYFSKIESEVDVVEVGIIFYITIRLYKTSKFMIVTFSRFNSEIRPD